MALTARELQVLDDVLKRLTESYGYTENALVNSTGTELGKSASYLVNASQLLAGYDSVNLTSLTTRFHFTTHCRS